MAYSKSEKMAIYGYVAVIKKSKNAQLRKVWCLGCFYENHTKILKISTIFFPVLNIYTLNMKNKVTRYISN